MAYVYMQKPCPAEVMGVQVTLTAFDANGNAENIGTVTSDGAGVFKKMWTPQNEGEYTIVASFDGSDSYWRSYAETAVGVGPASTQTGEVDLTDLETSVDEVKDNVSSQMTYILITLVLVIVALLVAIYCLLKK
jgi:hypothetical protein